MNGDERGFNPSEIENLTTYVGTTASRVAAEIENIINTRIMQPVSTGWAAPEAVEYFEGGIKPTVLASGQAITETYNNFIKALGNENDTRNINYVLWVKIFKPLGFTWGRNWSASSYDGMHFEIDWKNAK